MSSKRFGNPRERCRHISGGMPAPLRSDARMPPEGFRNPRERCPHISGDMPAPLRGDARIPPQGFQGPREPCRHISGEMPAPLRSDARIPAEGFPSRRERCPKISADSSYCFDAMPAYLTGSCRVRSQRNAPAWRGDRPGPPACAKALLTDLPQVGLRPGRAFSPASEGQGLRSSDSAATGVSPPATTPVPVGDRGQVTKREACWPSVPASRPFRIAPWSSSSRPEAGVESGQRPAGRPYPPS